MLLAAISFAFSKSICPFIIIYTSNHRSLNVKKKKKEGSNQLNQMKTGFETLTYFVIFIYSRQV